MAYVKSKKMRSKKKARKSRKMKRIRGGAAVQEPAGGESGAAGPVPNAAVRTTNQTNGAGQEPASVQEPANETSSQKAIKLLTGLKANLTTEPVTEADLDKIMTELRS